MSDLTGEDAFNRVLDAAMESRADLRKASERANEAEAKVRQLSSENEAFRVASRRDQDTLNREEAARTPKLEDLWVSAEAALATTADGEARARLHKALEAAREYCNQVPF